MNSETAAHGSAKVRTFRDLFVWQKGMDLVEATYAISARLPRHEMFGLRMQMERAAVSIPANIAEGHARKLTGEYLHHLAFAAGSAAELQTHLEIVVRLKYLKPEEVRLAKQLCEEESRMLHALMLRLKQKR